MNEEAILSKEAGGLVHWDRGTGNESALSDLTLRSSVLIVDDGEPFAQALKETTAAQAPDHGGNRCRQLDR